MTLTVNLLDMHPHFYTHSHSLTLTYIHIHTHMCALVQRLVSGSSILLRSRIRHPDRPFGKSLSASVAPARLGRFAGRTFGACSIDCDAGMLAR
jgi:hypothetical protein